MSFFSRIFSGRAATSSVTAASTSGAEAARAAMNQAPLSDRQSTFVRKLTARPNARALPTAAEARTLPAQRPRQDQADTGLGALPQAPSRKTGRLARVRQRIDKQLNAVHHAELFQRFGDFKANPTIPKAREFLERAALYRPGITLPANVRQARATYVKGASHICREWLDRNAAVHVQHLNGISGRQTAKRSVSAAIAAHARLAEKLWTLSEVDTPRSPISDPLICHVDANRTPVFRAYPLPPVTVPPDAPHWGHALMPGYIAGILRRRTRLNLPISLFTPARLSGQEVALTEVTSVERVPDPAQLSVQDQQRIAIAQLLTGHTADGWTMLRRDQHDHLQLAGLDRPPSHAEALHERGLPPLFHPLKGKQATALLQEPLDPVLRQGLRQLDLQDLEEWLDDAFVVAEQEQRHRASLDGEHAIFKPRRSAQASYLDVLARLKAAVLHSDDHTPFAAIWADAVADMNAGGAGSDVEQDEAEFDFLRDWDSAPRPTSPSTPTHTSPESHS